MLIAKHRMLPKKESQQLNKILKEPSESI